MVFYGIFMISRYEDGVQELNNERTFLDKKIELQFRRICAESRNVGRLSRRVCEVLRIPDSMCVYSADTFLLVAPAIIDEFEYAMLREDERNNWLEAKLFVNRVIPDACDNDMKVVRECGTLSRCKDQNFGDSISFSFHRKIACRAIEEFREKFASHQKRWLEANTLRLETSYELNHQSILIESEEAKRKKNFQLLGITLFFGVIFMITGFYFWYHRLQKFQDRNMKSGAGADEDFEG